MSVKFTLPTLAALADTATTRERILTAAVELLHTEGFSVLTQQAVAAKAGVRQSHVTYYFPSRNDLLRETAQFGCAQMLAPIEGAAASGMLTRENLRDALLPDVTDRAFVRLMIALCTASEEDVSIRAWLSDFDDGVRSRIQGAFAVVAVNVPDEVVHVLHALFVGSMNLDMALQTDASLAIARRNVKFLIDLALREYAVNPQEVHAHSASLTPRARKTQAKPALKNTKGVAKKRAGITTTTSIKGKPKGTLRKVGKSSASTVRKK